MKEITHKQARRYLRMDLDGLLTDLRRRTLQTHLDSCPACRAESETFASLTARLQRGFRSRWDAHDGPSHNVMANIRSQTRRIIMNKRIDFAFDIFGGIVTFLVLGFVILSVIAQFQREPIASNGTQTNVPASAARTESLLAFTSAMDDNLDIYTMYADGSELTNLTNHEALDSNPAWSPDGKRIAFQSNRAAFTQIYLMDADGSNVTQLTHDQIDHEMTMNYAQSSPWSPDGSHLLFFQRVYPEKGSPPVPLELYSIDINTGTKTMLARGNISLFNVTWSPDGKHIAFISENPSKSGEFHVFVVDGNGSNLNEITKSLHPNERLANFSYRWSPDGQSLIFIAENEKSQQWFAYEASLDGSPLVQRTRSNSTLGDWWNGTSFIVGFKTTLTWLRTDGTKSTLEPFEKCNSQDDPQYSWFYRRSSKGDYLVSVVCLHSSDLFFYFANSDGTGAKQLFNSPLSGDIIDTVWSDDGDQVIAILSTSIGIDLYRFDIEEMLKDPSTKPVQLTADGALKSGVVWQPIP
jgi:TolB protein